MRFADAFAARPVGPGFALWGRRHLSALAVTSASDRHRWCWGAARTRPDAAAPRPSVLARP